MKNLKIFLLLGLILLFSFQNIPGQDEGCDECITNPASCCDEFPGICKPPPGNDHADDSLSASDFVSGRSFIDTGKGTVTIIYNGYWKASEQLFGNFSDNINLVEITGDSRPDFVVLPSGALFGKRNDSTFKYALEQYVSQGGIILCFAQQDAGDYSVIPVPEGSQLKAEGWGNSQSCIHGSIYFDTDNMHPALSGQTSQRISAGVDGGFNLLPGGAKILISRTANNQPALVEYPYGDKGGKIILSSTYSDWNYAKGYCTMSELKLIRDLVSYCKSKLPIPMFNLELNPTPGISLNIKLKNDTDIPAARAKLTAYNPDRTRILYENQVSISLNPGEEVEVPIQFTLPQMDDSEMGIAHVDYELYDSENNKINFAEESDSGGFALYRVVNPYTYNRQIDAWISSSKETIYFSQQVEFTFHLRNNSDEIKTLDLKYTWNHDLFKQDLQTVTIPAGEQVDLNFNLSAPPYAEYISSYRGGRVAMLFRLWYASTQTNQFSQATKGIVFKTPETKSSIVQIQPYNVQVGNAFSYTIQVINESDIDVGDTSIAVTLEKLEWPDNTYVQINQIYDTTHAFTGGETFSYNGNYTPDPVQESGMYRLKMEVQKPEGSKEENYSNFFYVNSNIGVKVDPLQDSTLLAGTSYPVKIVLVKHSDFSIFNGRYAIIFKTPDGQTACRKDVDNLVLHGYRSIPIDDTITFNPTILAPYYRLCVEYSDETILTPRVTDSGKRYQFKYSATLELDKDVYFYRDTAHVSLHIFGAGSFDVHFTCTAAGIDEQRVVTVPTGSMSTVEVFQVPIGLISNYNARFAITSREGFYSTFGGQLSIPIPKIPLQLEANGTFGDITAKVGTPIDFNLKIKGISGFTTPLDGMLKVSCMNYTDVQNVSLLPMGDNNFSYNIPVEDSINAGIYHAYVSFQHEGSLLISKNFPINLPAPDIKLSEPSAQLNAGDSFVLALENPGGKNGEYQWEVYLKDQGGNAVLEYVNTDTLPINAGYKQEITLTIPGDAASGPYILFQKAKETNTNREIVHYSGHQVTGVSVTLNGYTLKEKYFDNEPVSGKAEMTMGSGDMEKGQLQASIVQYMESQGIEEQKPGEFIAYNMIESGFSSGTMLYLVADKGVLAYDVESGTVDVRYSFDDSTGFNSRDLLVSSAGELWIASTYGIWRQNTQGNWEHYSTVDGLADNWIYDVMEVNGTSGSEIWAGTGGGISVYRGG